jgi:hypothetical protein
MNIQAINTAIINGTWASEDLNSMIDAVKFARKRLGERSKASIQVGDNVEFTSSKTGRRTRGFVRKIAIKFITVDTGMGMWRVPASMLTKVEAEFA